MIMTLIRILALIAGCSITGVLGIIWLFGDHASIFVTVGVKPFAVILLFISFILFEQIQRELKRINRYK